MSGGGYLGGSTIIKPPKKNKRYFKKRRERQQRNNNIHNDQLFVKKIYQEITAEWKPEYILIKKDDK